ncbi:MAG: hypothetical protein AB1721_00140 [Patescibacteria group bacterium]
MIEIIPSINKSTWPEVEQDIKKAESFADWIELDIGDGSLGQAKTWDNPEDLKSLKLLRPIRFAAHLMIKNPDKVIENWIGAGIRRIIVQYEGIAGGLWGRKRKKTIKQIADECKNNWVEFGISISPKTSVAKLRPFLGSVDLVQILAVPIGLSGYGFDEKQLRKAEELRIWQDQIFGETGFGYKIEWDGGVDIETVKKIKAAGAEIIASTSFVFGAAEPAQAVEALVKVIRE